MITTCVFTNNGELKYNVPLQTIREEGTVWYWVDFSAPNKEEEKLLDSFFHFHPLAIEDCLDTQIGRPKLDFYESYTFFLFHSIDQRTLEAREVNMFINNEMIVTYHKENVEELNNQWKKAADSPRLQKGPFFILHSLIDGLVDKYFPPVYRLEDLLNQADEDTDQNPDYNLIEHLFDIRHDMAKLRRSILPMRDLVYRILNSGRLEFIKDQQIYFRDIYDHLLKLVEMLESYREFSSDVRDNYLSVNSDKMNSIMMTLTVITTIFMPLTFIAGIYGMNFRYMPELETRYGYFFILGFMLLVALAMLFIFMKAGWLVMGKKKRKKKYRRITLK